MGKKKTGKKSGTISKAAKSLLGDESSRRGASRLKSFTGWKEGMEEEKKPSPGPSAREAATMAEGYGIPPAEFIRMMETGWRKREPAIEIAVSSGEMEPLARYEHGRGGGPEEGNITYGRQDSEYQLDPKLRKEMSDEYRQPSHTKRMTPWVGKERADWPGLAKDRDEMIAWRRERQDEDDEKRTKWHKKHTEKGKDVSKAKGRAPKR
jgi:hypothetical protein